MTKFLTEYWRQFIAPSGKLEVQTEGRASLPNGEIVVMTGTLTFEVLKAIAEEKDVKFTLEEGQLVSFNLYEINSHIADKVLDFFDQLPVDGSKGTLQINGETGEAVYNTPTSIADAFTTQSNYKLKRAGLPRIEIL